MSEADASRLHGNPQATYRFVEVARQYLDQHTDAAGVLQYFQSGRRHANVLESFKELSQHLVLQLPGSLNES